MHCSAVQLVVSVCRVKHRHPASAFALQMGPPSARHSLKATVLYNAERLGALHSLVSTTILQEPTLN